MKYVNIANTTIKAMVDDEDRDLKYYKWRLHPRGYVQTTFPNYGDAYMHRVVMERVVGRALETYEQVDHINGVKTDNQRDNLRLANNAQNNQNRPKQSNNTTGYRGVSFNSRLNRYRATIQNKHLGYFDTAKEAALAYNDAAIELFGEFAHPNEVEL